MDEKVSYIVFEGEMARQERTVKRLWIVILVLIILLTGTNGAWLYYESQFKTIETTTVNQDVESDSGNAIVNGTGEMIINDSN